jgi:hypothetical protein
VSFWVIWLLLGLGLYDPYYALSMSRLDSTRSVRGRIPRSVEIYKVSSSILMAFSESPDSSRSRSISA